ncbi:unnamed protein product, partial [Amoebophrya sp. A25]|eukprot:GSA25T00018630001.1
MPAENARGRFPPSLQIAQEQEDLFRLYERNQIISKGPRGQVISKPISTKDTAFLASEQLGISVPTMMSEGDPQTAREDGCASTSLG